MIFHLLCFGFLLALIGKLTSDNFVLQLNMSEDLFLEIFVDLFDFARLLLDVLVHAVVFVVLGLMIDALCLQGHTKRGTITTEFRETSKLYTLYRSRLSAFSACKCRSLSRRDS